MDANFWHDKWKTNVIGFHENQPNPLLLQHCNALTIAKNSRIFLPLCGKTLDIHWLLAQGFRVVGAELSVIAVDQLFAELGLSPQITPLDGLLHYQADGIDIYAGNIFDLSKSQIGEVDAIYDRAALVALPADMRIRYTQHLMQLTDAANQLLIAISYDQTQLQGPPFAIHASDVNAYYAADYHLRLLNTYPIEGGLKGQCPAQSNVWLLQSTRNA